MFVKLTNVEGNPIWVNTSNVSWIEPGVVGVDGGAKTVIYSGAATLYVKETPEEVVALITPIWAVPNGWVVPGDLDTLRTVTIRDD